MISVTPLQGLGALLLIVLYLLIFPGRRGRNFPPGPPTLPLIGNLHQLPKTGAHFKFLEWAQKYGDIFSLKIGPATAVVISSPSIVKELIDKKSAIYSDRPPSYIGRGLISHNDHFVLMNVGERWRLLRKLTHHFFNAAKCEKEHLVVQNAEAVQMLRDFCIEPDQLMLHPVRFSNSIIMSLLYGIRTPTTTTSHMAKMAELMEKFSNIMEVGATPPVDIVPILKWVPEGFFGNWITRALNIREMMDGLYGGMVSQVIQRRSMSDTRASFVDGVLDQQEKLNLTSDQLNFLCGNLLEGGSDTSASVILVFIHAMIKFPHVQKTAQQHIDSAIGDDRSPLWSDYVRLPYIAMVVKETMRWRSMTPLAVPHYSTQDDTINGMTIPKGTTIFLNVWGIHHDPTRFPSPDTFDPNRFTGRTLLAPEYAAAPSFEHRDHFGYGSGRRICPGIHLAERNLFLAIAKLLWAFDFSPKKDARGGIIEVDVDARTGYRQGILQGPKPFEADVTPRSEERRKTIMREFERVEEEVFSKF